MVEETSSSRLMTPPAHDPHRLVYVPNILRRQGWGHFRRCRDAALTTGSALYLAYDLLSNQKTFTRDELLSQSGGCRIVFSVPSREDFETVVLDFQKTPAVVYTALQRGEFFMVGWDEGGPCRSKLPFLADSLPNLSAVRPNVRQESLTGIFRKKKDLTPEFEHRGSFQRVLVVFGGADPRNLTPRTLDVMDKAGFFAGGREVTVIRGPAVRWSFPSKNFPVKVLGAPDNLPDLLESYDLVVTSWGLTALEALACGVPVVLFNPEVYHDRLSQKEGLAVMGVRHTSVQSFRRALDRAVAASILRSERIPERSQKTAAEFFPGLTSSSGVCPVCSQRSTQVLYRLSTKTYFRCPSCGLEFLQTFNLPAKEYQESYFFEDYRRQYGKTYLEDFDSIKKWGSSRLSFAQSLGFSPAGKTVFDVGCAFGPFLKAVQEQGANGVGLDISPQAVDYVKSHLGIPAVCAPFPHFQWEEAFPTLAKPDMVTLWYVIEHFEDLNRVLETLSGLLAPGGWLALSTPHGMGISRIFRTQRFWEQSPDDHFSIWNRANAVKILRRYGFRVRGFRITGRHPERFPGVSSKSSFLYKVISVFDRLFGWGDTFEIYAVKESS